MGRLTGKVAIITGAAGGQGAVEARLFAKEGANVVATDMQDELLAKTVEEINEEFGNRVIGLKHNVSNEDEWIDVVDETIKHFGKIDILVNNAGILGTIGVSVTDLELKEWQKVFDVNVAGTFLGIKHVAQEMKKNGSGSIINISSVAGLVGGQGAAHYTASKGAIRLLTKSVALELAKDGIRVNSVHPGAIATPMLNNILNDKLNKAFKSSIPLGYIATSEDIAYPVLFLASDESRYMTGSEVVVDGGLTTR